MTDILEALRRSLASIAAVVGLVVLWQLMTMKMLLLADASGKSLMVWNPVIGFGSTRG